MEQEIKTFLENYFVGDDLKIMKRQYFHDYDHDDCNFSDITYQQLVCKYKAILNIKDDNYRIEVDKCCRVLMDKIFSRYGDDSTFVVTAEALMGYIKKEVADSVKNKYLIIYGAEEYLKKDLIDDILQQFKKSNCKRIFVLLPSVCPCFGYVTPNELFIKLKKTFETLHIPNIFILDDCQGVLYQENTIYDMFDGILISSHVLFLNFSMGILITKLKEKIGFVNKQGLLRFYEKFEVLNKNKEKAKQFQKLMYDFFDDIIDNTKVSKPKVLSNSYQANFIFNNFDVSNNVKNKMRSDYGFSFNKNVRKVSYFRIRLHEALIIKPDHFIEGLKTIKKIIRRQQRKMELSKNKDSWDQDFVEEKIKSSSTFYKSLLDFIGPQNVAILNQIRENFIQIGYINNERGR